MGTLLVWWAAKERRLPAACEAGERDMKTKSKKMFKELGAACLR